MISCMWVIVPDAHTILTCGTLHIGRVGCADGAVDGCCDGHIDGSDDGSMDGSADGLIDGSIEGSSDGFVVGSVVGADVGAAVGAGVGAIVGGMFTIRNDIILVIPLVPLAFAPEYGVADTICSAP